MFDVRELGPFGEYVSRDGKGMVPEPGDDWREMDWGFVEPTTPEEERAMAAFWQKHLARTAAEVAEARQLKEDWERGWVN